MLPLIGGRRDLLERFMRDWRATELDERTRAMLEFAETATRAPGAVEKQDIDCLRSRGLSDVEILDVVLTIALFAFVNRVSSLLGVEPPARGHEHSRVGPA